MNARILRNGLILLVILTVANMFFSYNLAKVSKERGMRVDAQLKAVESFKKDLAANTAQNAEIIRLLTRKGSK